MSEVMSLWRDAVVLLTGIAPLHASVLVQMKVLEDDSLPHAAATDGYSTVWLSPRELLEGTRIGPYLSAQRHADRVGQMAALAAHEAEHVLRFVGRLHESLMAVDWVREKFPDPDHRRRVTMHAANVAQDFVINRSLYEIGLDIPGQAVRLSEYVDAAIRGKSGKSGRIKLLDHSLDGRSESAVALEILRLLPPQADFTMPPETMDAHDRLDSDPSLDKRRTDLLTRAAVQVRSMGMRGNIPGDFEWLVSDPARAVRIPWPRLFARALQATLAGRADWTPMQPNRLLQTLGSPVLGFGDEFKGLRRLGFAIDTSASMGEKELELAVGVLRDVLRRSPPETVVYVQCDTKVQSVKELRFGAFDAATLRRMQGGGGTAFGPALEALKGCDMIVYVTDGYGGNPPAPTCPVIWLTTTGHCSAKFGKVIKVE